MRFTGERGYNKEGTSCIIMRGGSFDYSTLTARGSNHVLHLLEGGRGIGRKGYFSRASSAKKDLTIHV